jgi:hypothetical protein
MFFSLPSIEDLLYYGGIIVAGIGLYMYYKYCIKRQKQDLAIQVGCADTLPILINAKKDLWKKPLKEQAEYADIITRNGCNSEFIRRQILEMEIPKKKEDIGQWNTTSIGNLAYIALYSKSIRIRYRAMKMVTEYNRLCST